MMRMDLSHLHWIERESPFSEILSIKFSLNGVSYLCIFTLGTYDEKQRYTLFVQFRDSRR